MIPKSQTITLNADLLIPKGVVIPNLYADNSPIKQPVTMFKKGVILKYVPRTSWNTERCRVFQVSSNGVTNEWPCDSHIFKYVWNKFRTEDLIQL